MFFFLRAWWWKRKLKSPEAYVRRSAITELGQVGGRGCIPLVLKALEQDPDRDVRRCAAEVLGVNGVKQAAEPLARRLQDKNEDIFVRRWAAAALGHIGGDLACDALLASFRDKDVQPLVIEAMGDVKHPRALETLVAALGDEEEEVRRLAAQALGHHRDSRAVDPLRKLAQDDTEHEKVRQAAARALAEIGWRP
jgi:HEAT repeat protein